MPFIRNKNWHLSFVYSDQSNEIPIVNPKTIRSVKSEFSENRMCLQITVHGIRLRYKYRAHSSRSMNSRDFQFTHIQKIVHSSSIWPLFQFKHRQTTNSCRMKDGPFRWHITYMYVYMCSLLCHIQNTNAFWHINIIIILI